MFYWGSATSAYQVEGGNENDFSGGGLDAGRACSHYYRYEKDFDIAKSLGQNAHRLSIEWSRIEPEKGEFRSSAIEHYKKVIHALKKRGLEPFVTLWHFTNPAWLAKAGGWANSEAVNHFVRYAKFIVVNLKDQVKFWLFLNEPEVYADMSYARGKWPPFKYKPIKACRRVLRNLRTAHQAAYDILKKVQPDGQFGIATNLVGGSPLARRIFNFFNHGTLSRINNRLDFIGLNYYTKVSLNPRKKIYPPGIYQTIKDLQKYRKPIYITENGVADAEDKVRADFIKDHIGWMKKAMDEGADIRGYFHWSLLDNYEWHHGFKARFGLVEVDYDTLERKVRQSAYKYAQIIKNFQF